MSVNSSKNEIKYKGSFQLNTIDLECYVLADSTRVISARGMQRALGMVDENETQSSGKRLQRHLEQESLSPYLYDGKNKNHYDPIICYEGRKKINGYRAELLIDICIAFKKAKENIALSPRQKIVADSCEIVLMAFAKVGIIATIDEATGYQYTRHEAAIRAILKRIISDEILAYEQQFPLSTYKELFRLWNVPFTEKNIKRKPLFIGHLTNKYIYSNFPEGKIILKELKKRTPKTKSGNLKYRLHQSLTKSEGREMLKKVLYTVEGFASIADNKEEFEAMVKKRFNNQSELPFPGDVKGKQ